MVTGMRKIHDRLYIDRLAKDYLKRNTLKDTKIWFRYKNRITRKSRKKDPPKSGER